MAMELGGKADCCSPCSRDEEQDLLTPRLHTQMVGWAPAVHPVSIRIFAGEEDIHDMLFLVAVRCDQNCDPLVRVCVSHMPKFAGFMSQASEELGELQLTN